MLKKKMKQPTMKKRTLISRVFGVELNRSFFWWWNGKPLVFFLVKGCFDVCMSENNTQKKDV
jgi:hypothetical protein